MAAKLWVFVDEDHSKLPTLLLLPELHKRSYKLRFMANSSSCTTTESLQLKNISLNIAQQFMKEMVNNYFDLLKIQVKFLINWSLEVF